MNEITKFLAEEVLKKELFDTQDNPPFIGIKIDGYWQPFDPMNNIADAFMVVEGVMKKPNILMVELCWNRDSKDSEQWAAEFTKDDFNTYNTWDNGLPKAICYAAVRALGTDEQIGRLL